MASDPIRLVYIYAPEDRPLLEDLEKHLAPLQRQGLITTWHGGKLLPGSDRQRERERRLEQAQIVLLLISPDLLATDDCYDATMQRTLERQRRGTLHLVPVLLRPVNWQGTPFAHLEPLPSNAQPVTLWKNRDAAFADVVGGLRELIAVSQEERERLRGQEIAYNEGRGPRKGASMREEVIVSQPAALTPTLLKRAIARYRKELASYEGLAQHELALRTAFQNLLAETASAVNLKLVPEATIERGLRPDGVLRDLNDFLTRGLWEAKRPGIDLERAIAEKLQAGYPTRNTLFEDSRRAILFQDGQRLEFDLHSDAELQELLRRFLTYSEPQIERFEAAVAEFKDQIPVLARTLLEIIERERQQNRAFVAALERFAQLCRSSLNPQISQAEITEMLAQHLLTERLFRTIFDNPDFVNRNIIARQIEQVIQALTSRSFNRQEFLRSLDRFYGAIEDAARGIRDWSERQHFLNTVYERFFQGFSLQKADTHGIVYTPQEIVDFMVASVEDALQQHFGLGLASPGVKVLDPCTGTGNFIVNILQRLPRSVLRQKYRQDLFCNEIMLLPYYIASLNIEHAYYERMGEYEPFEGLCFVDTLELAGKIHSDGSVVAVQPRLFLTEENTQRVVREQEADLMVIVGNPPYNVGQKSENENNPNRAYPQLDRRVGETYARDSRASNRNKLYDAYVRFFRWATDRLGSRDGIICFITNNGFLEGIGFDGFRKRLAEEFTTIYHLDLGGDARKRQGGNVFGIRVGVGITLLVRHRAGRPQPGPAEIFYHRVDDSLDRRDRLAWLKEHAHLSTLAWERIQPTSEHHWLGKRLQADYTHFLPLGSREARNALASSGPVTLFRLYSLGVNTNRDHWVYDFDRERLAAKVQQMIEVYNTDLLRWRSQGTPPTIDSFVTADEARIKWSSRLKEYFARQIPAEFRPEAIRHALYRPFTRMYLYFDPMLNQRRGSWPLILPTPACERENIAIVVSDIGYRSTFSVLATNLIPDLHLLAAVDTFQCFPFYTYSEDGTTRQENITDAALERFQQRYGPDVHKWDLFYYVYGLLHHPLYRTHYADALKRDLPRIPLLRRDEAFWATASIGRSLATLHISYEQASPYPLRELEDERLPYRESRQVEKMRLTPDRSSLVVSRGLTLSGIPQECFAYRLGNRSALEWVIDQYQRRIDPRSGLLSDPNRPDDPDAIVRLVRQVITVSLTTLQLIDELQRAVQPADWGASLAL
jgi:predicted helicase